jgi:hypothetical protein
MLLMCAARHAFMRSKMTLENENHQAVTLGTTKAPKKENILLNWILIIAGMGVIGLLGKYVPALFAMFR